MMQHRADIGWSKNIKNKDIEEMTQFILNYMNKHTMKLIYGTWRKDNATIFYDSATHLAFIVNAKDGKFITFFKPTVQQIRYLLSTGNLS
jgi:hypothetical protein